MIEKIIAVCPKCKGTGRGRRKAYDIFDKRGYSYIDDFDSECEICEGKGKIELEIKKLKNA